MEAAEVVHGAHDVNILYETPVIGVVEEAPIDWPEAGIGLAEFVVFLDLNSFVQDRHGDGMTLLRDFAKMGEVTLSKELDGLAVLMSTWGGSLLDEQRGLGPRPEACRAS